MIKKTPMNNLTPEISMTCEEDPEVWWYVYKSTKGILTLSENYCGGDDKDLWEISDFTDSDPIQFASVDEAHKYIIEQLTP